MFTLHHVGALAGSRQQGGKVLAHMTRVDMDSFKRRVNTCVIPSTQTHTHTHIYKDT